MYPPVINLTVPSEILAGLITFYFIFWVNVQILSCYNEDIDDNDKNPSDKKVLIWKVAIVSITTLFLLALSAGLVFVIVSISPPN